MSDGNPISDDAREPLTLDYQRRPPVRRRWGLVMSIALAHFAATSCAFLASFAMGMARFDTGGVETPAEAALGVATQVLMFPLVTASLWLRIGAPGPAGWLIVFANSLCWGLAIAWVIDQLRRRRHRQT